MSVSVVLFLFVVLLARFNLDAFGDELVVDHCVGEGIKVGHEGYK